MRLRGLTALAAALAVLGAPGFAQDKKDEKEAAAAAPERIEPQVRVTKHSGVFGGQKVNFSATIGETVLKGEDGTQKAAVVTTAYVREPRDPIHRQQRVRLLG